MQNFENRGNAPRCCTIHGDPDMAGLSREPIYLDGREFAACEQLQVGKTIPADGLPGVILLMSVNRNGPAQALQLQLTPDGARAIASAMLRAAADADEQARPMILARITGKAAQP